MITTSEGFYMLDQAGDDPNCADVQLQVEPDDNGFVVIRMSDPDEGFRARITLDPEDAAHLLRELLPAVGAARRVVEAQAS
jgi:hypothetical protein